MTRPSMLRVVARPHRARSGPAARLAAVSGLTLACASSALAQSEWKNPVDGNWYDNPTKWTTAVPNAATAQVIIAKPKAQPNDPNYTVTLDKNGVTDVKSLVVGNDAATLYLMKTTLRINDFLLTVTAGNLFLDDSTINKVGLGNTLNLSGGQATSLGSSAINTSMSTSGTHDFGVESKGDKPGVLDVTGDCIVTGKSIFLDVLGGTTPQDVTLKVGGKLYIGANTKLQFLDFAGGNRIFTGSGNADGAGSFTSDGTVQVKGLTQWVTTAAKVQYIQRGTFTVDSILTGDRLVIDGKSNNPTFNQNKGTLTTNFAMRLIGTTFLYDGGTIAGNLKLQTSTLKLVPGAIAAATFEIRGGATAGANPDVLDYYSKVVGDIPANQTVQVLATPTERLSGFGWQDNNGMTLTNKGRIILTSTAGKEQGKPDPLVAFGRTNAQGVGVFENQGVVQVFKDGGGGREFYGTFNNRKDAVLDIHSDMKFASSGAAANNLRTHVNEGYMGLFGPQKGDPAFLTITFGKNSSLDIAKSLEPKPTLQGNGKITGLAKLKNAGKIMPGKLNAPSGPEITGSIELEGEDGGSIEYTQVAGGDLDIRIGGPTQIYDYDTLTIHGSAILEPGAVANLSLVNGYLPPGPLSQSDPIGPVTFDILTATDFISGDMSLGQNASWNGLSFQLAKIAPSVDRPFWAIQAQVIPGPGAMSLLGTMGVLALRRRRA